MARRKPKLREDVAERAYRTLQEALGEQPKTLPPDERSPEQRNAEAVKRGQQGGKVRAETLTKNQRSRQARSAAKSRWKGQE